MQQRLTFITLGVKDLEMMKTFYKEKFGWTTMHDQDGIVFFRLNGFILSMFPAQELAADAGVAFNEAPPFKGFTLALCLNSVEEVNALFDELRKKDVKIVKEPEKVFWGGYSGYFSDPENNLWEIAHNPFLVLDADGNVAAT